MLTRRLIDNSELSSHLRTRLSEAGIDADHAQVYRPSLADLSKATLNGLPFPMPDAETAVDRFTVVSNDGRTVLLQTTEQPSRFNMYSAFYDLMALVPVAGPLAQMMAAAVSAEADTSPVRNAVLRKHLGLGLTYLALDVAAIPTGGLSYAAHAALGSAMLAKDYYDTWRVTDSVSIVDIG